MLYILIIISPPPTIPGSSPISVPKKFISTLPLPLLQHIKNTKQRKTIRQEIQKQYKKPTKKYRICFVLANYCWAWDLSWYMVYDILNETLLEKTDFPFAGEYQLLQTASCLGEGPCVHCLLHHETLPSLYLSRFCSYSHNHKFIWMPVLLYLEDSFLGVIHHLHSFNLSAPLTHKSLSPGGEEFNKNIPFRTVCSKVPYSLHIVELWVSLLIFIHCKDNSLVRVEWDNWYIIRSHFIAMLLIMLCLAE